MVKDYALEHELLRRQCWLIAWGAATGASGIDTTSTASRRHLAATAWANRALVEFDKMFLPLETPKSTVAP